MNSRRAIGARRGGVPFGTGSRVSETSGVEMRKEPAPGMSIRWPTLPMRPVATSRTTIRTWWTPAGSSISWVTPYQSRASFSRVAGRSFMSTRWACSVVSPPSRPVVVNAKSRLARERPSSSRNPSDRTSTSPTSRQRVRPGVFSSKA